MPLKAILRAEDESKAHESGERESGVCGTRDQIWAGPGDSPPSPPLRLSWAGGGGGEFTPQLAGRAGAE